MSEVDFSKKWPDERMLPPLHPHSDRLQLLAIGTSMNFTQANCAAGFQGM
jgi:hypothetical protein